MRMSDIVEAKAQSEYLPLRPMGWVQSLTIFGFFSVLLWTSIYWGIDWLRHSLGLSLMMSWFISGTVIALLPMIVYTIYMTRRDGWSGVRGMAGRLRLKKPNGSDIKWVGGGLLAVAVLSGLLFEAARVIDPKFLPIPPFMETRTGSLLGLFLAWIPLYICNIVGEELLWRGYVLPRQEVAFGRTAWLVNGVFWLLFHWSTKLPTMVLILPTTLIVPWIVQRRRNTWVGILTHGVFNAVGFIATVTGLTAHL